MSEGSPRRLQWPAVLREEPQYRLLFSSQVLSVLGDRVTQVALPFAVLGIGGGVSGIASVSAAQFLPYLVMALPAGVWADQRDRKRILITSDAVRMLCQLAAAALLLGEAASVTSLVFLAGVYGLADAFFAPAFTGLLPATVTPQNLQAANALRGLTFSTASITGPVLAALLIASGGAASALAFDAVTFAISIALAAPLQRSGVSGPGRGQPRAGTDDRFLASLKDGWTQVSSRAWVSAFLVAILIYHLVVQPAILVLGPVVMTRELDGADSWAVVMSCFGVGAVLGNLLALHLRPAYPMRIASMLVLGASCQPAVIGSGLPAWEMGGLMMLAAMCLAGAGTLWETSLAEHIPGDALSRVASYDYLSSKGVIPIGTLLAGALSAAVDLETLLLSATAIAMSVGVMVAAVPAVRSLPARSRQRTAQVAVEQCFGTAG